MRKLDLGHNSLSDVGAAENLVTHWSQSNTDPLELLDLSKNELSCTSLNKLLTGATLGGGATTVPSALRSNTQLKVLDLGTNESLFDRRYNTTLEGLEFGGNDLCIACIGFC